MHLQATSSDSKICFNFSIPISRPQIKKLYCMTWPKHDHDSYPKTLKYMDLRATSSNSRDLVQLHNAQSTTTKEIRKQFESHNNHTYGNSQHTENQNTQKLQTMISVLLLLHHVHLPSTCSPWSSLLLLLLRSSELFALSARTRQLGLLKEKVFQKTQNCAKNRQKLRVYKITEKFAKHWNWLVNSSYNPPSSRIFRTSNCTNLTACKFESNSTSMTNTSYRSSFSIIGQLQFANSRIFSGSHKKLLKISWQPNCKAPNTQHPWRARLVTISRI